MDLAIENFKQVRKLDPYRLDNMDTYSNALYVKVGNLEESIILLDDLKKSVSSLRNFFRFYFEVSIVN